MLRYPDLARYLGDDQPFYGLQSPAVHEEPIVYRSIEEMATQYVEEIRKLQPEGPYFLGGHSYGGMIVFEMAQQLQRQGQNVALLAMLDAPGPNFEHKHTTDYYRQALTQHSLSDRLVYITDGLIRRFKYHTNQFLRYMAALWFKQIERPLSDDLRLTRIIEFNTRAIETYEPQVYPGKLTLLCGEVLSADTELGWTHWAGDGVEVHFVPGNHDDFLYEPGVCAVAAQLASCLENARANVYHP